MCQRQILLTGKLFHEPCNYIMDVNAQKFFIKLNEPGLERIILYCLILFFVIKPCLFSDLRFEDGTISFLDIIALNHSFDALHTLTGMYI